MEKNSNLNSNQNSRIFMLSQRELRDHYSNCPYYEFEDVICDLEAVNLFTAQINTSDSSGKFYRVIKELTGFDPYVSSSKIYQLAKYITKFKQFASSISTKSNACILDRDYELFLAIFATPFAIGSLSSLTGFRQKCQKAVCYLVEAWDGQIQDFSSLLEPLKDFDHIFLGISHITEAVAEFTGRPCTYLPLGVDAVKFYPSLGFHQRPIDVCSIGRRSPVTHQALLNMAEQEKIFYYYDTIKGYQAFNLKEHRSLIANLIKRSRYFIANYANINESYKTKGKCEIGARFFEGAAAGTVMIGDCPTTEVFKQYFDWPDAAIRIPFDSPNIAEIIAELDAQPERLAQISRDNVVNSLLRHDWVYRWRKILEAVDFKPTPEMLSREAYLKKLAHEISARNSLLI